MASAALEEFIFIIAIDRAIPSTPLVPTTAERIGAIIRALEATGTRIGAMRTTIQAFARAFELIGAAYDAGDYLAQGAIAASPHDLLNDDDPNWRMGYFDAETVEMIHDEASEHRAALQALDAYPQPVPGLRDLLLAACDEAAASGQSLVILHSAT